MAVATKKRPKATVVKKDVIDAAGSFLESLPEKPKAQLSLREAMGQMKESIQAALARGYSYQDLADQLAKQGINISASTLKNYVPTGKRQAAKERKAAAATTPSKRGRKPKADSAVALTAEPASTKTSTRSSTKKATSNGAAPSKSTAGTSTRGRKAGTTTAAKSTTPAKSSTRAKSTTTASKSTRGRKKAES